MSNLCSFFNFRPRTCSSVESSVDQKKDFENVVTLKSDHHVKIHRPIWEFRLFWPDHKNPVCLHSPSFSSLSHTQFQPLTLQDTYILIDHKFLNLKIRHNKLAYKPLLEQEQGMLAYGQKIKFSFPLNWQKLYLLLPRLSVSTKTCPDLITFQKTLYDNGYQTQCLTFDKTVRRYKFKSCLQLELSQFDLNHQKWFSLCIEGSSYNLIQQEVALLEGSQGDMMGYVEFLKTYGQL